MAHSSNLSDQGMTQKMIYISHHMRNHFEDPLMGDFFESVLGKKRPSLSLERSIRKGLYLFHNVPRGTYGKLDF